MGAAAFEYRELRFVIEPTLLQVYISVRALGDAPLGVQGWHHKTFDASTSVLDVLEAIKRGDEEPILWPLEAPGGSS